MGEWLEYCYNKRGTAKTIRIVQHRKKPFDLEIFSSREVFYYHTYLLRHFTGDYDTLLTWRYSLIYDIRLSVLGTIEGPILQIYTHGGCILITN